MVNWFNTELGTCFAKEACAHVPNLIPYGYHGVAYKSGRHNRTCWATSTVVNGFMLVREAVK